MKHLINSTKSPTHNSYCFFLIIEYTFLAFDFLSIPKTLH